MVPEATPPVTVTGAVVKASFVAAPATSISVPKLLVMARPPACVAVPENAPEPHQAAARRLAQALSYRIIKRNFTNDPGPETIWFQLGPSGYQVKPWYVIVIDQNVYVRASSYEALDRAVDRLIRSAGRIPAPGAPHGARLPRGVMTDYDVIPEE